MGELIEENTLWELNRLKITTQEARTEDEREEDDEVRKRWKTKLWK